MNLSLDASLDGGPVVRAAAAVLVKWYASQPVVRHLWAIEEIEVMRIVVTLEPTHDGKDTEPAWLANSWSWAQELQLHMQRIVRLEMLTDVSHIEPAFESGCALIAEVSWRDPSVG